MSATLIVKQFSRDDKVNQTRIDMIDGQFLIFFLGETLRAWVMLLLAMYDVLHLAY